METILEFQNVSYKYSGEKNWVLKDINLKIPRNSFFVLAGPSGCGKTTLLTLARGFYKEYGGAFGGDIFVSGENIKEKDIAELGSKIGIVFQDPALQLHQLRVIDEVMSALMYQNLPFEECEKRAKKIIKEILDESFCQRSPQELSCGEQQKVALAASLVMDCDILLLDEPFSFLNEKADKELMEILLKLKQKGKTIVMATHDLEQIAKYADQIALMDKGKVVLQGRSQEVLYSKELEEILTTPLLIKMGKALLSKGKSQHPIVDWLDLTNKFKQEINQPKKQIEQKTNFKKDALKLNNLVFHYSDNKKGVENINLPFYEKEIVGIIGANGSSKTTLAKLVLGLLKPQQGKIELKGKDITKLSTSERAKQIGYVTQNPIDMLFEENVLKECMFGPKCLKLDNPEKRAKDTLAKMDLLKYKDKHPDSLSGGERSKLAIADILASQGAILVLDEPEFGLDIKSWQAIAQILKQIKNEGKTIIVITQDLEISLFLCDRIAIMKEGKILQIGAPKEIFCNNELLTQAQLPSLPIFQLLNLVLNEALLSEEKFVENIISLI